MKEGNTGAQIPTKLSLLMFMLLGECCLIVTAESAVFRTHLQNA
jgi:hypothetical protein